MNLILIFGTTTQPNFLERGGKENFGFAFLRIYGGHEDAPPVPQPAPRHPRQAAGLPPYPARVPRAVGPHGPAPGHVLGRRVQGHHPVPGVHLRDLLHFHHVVW